MCNRGGRGALSLKKIKGWVVSCWSVDGAEYAEGEMAVKEKGMEEVMRD